MNLPKGLKCSLRVASDPRCDFCPYLYLYPFGGVSLENLPTFLILQPWYVLRNVKWSFEEH